MTKALFRQSSTAFTNPVSSAMDETNILVSVVLPTYNRSHILGRAIQSILNQTYHNFEIIIVDDCSTDNTDYIVKKFDDSRIRYIRHSQNKGGSVARNTGIKAARGEYIAFQDSDDEWLPTKLQKQLDSFIFESSNLGVVYTSFKLIDKGRTVIVPDSKLAKHAGGNIHNLLLKGNFVNTPTAIVRKKCFEKVGMFEDVPRYQDWILWLKLSKYYHFKHINEPLVNAYRQPDSISRNIAASVVARRFILKKYYHEISKKPALIGKYYFEIGTSLCLNGDIKTGRSYLFRAVMFHPFNLKLILSTFASLFNQEIYNKLAILYLRSNANKSQKKLNVTHGGS